MRGVALPPSEPVRVGGLLSGTSMDGADVLFLELQGPLGGEWGVDGLRWKVLAFETRPWPLALREEIREGCRGGTARVLAQLHVRLGEAFAEAVLAVIESAGLAPREITAIGSHGQTVWHEPPREGRRGASLQLGDPATLAERTGIPVVSDFRARDVAAGGHGAPLVPWADRVLLHRPGRGRALQNLGGMGNVTFLPADGATTGIRAFDTGPGVSLLDGAVRRATRGRLPWDVDGEMAARGDEDEALLADLLSHPFFDEVPPRSTGRERFGDAFLDEVISKAKPETTEDWDNLIATLTALTAESVARAYRDFLPSEGLDEVILTGGGARNSALVRRIERAVDPLPVITGSEALGIDPDAREAAAFALLAWAHLQGIPGNLPSATGADAPRILGSFTPGRAVGGESR
ncbi:MAG: anhydro-N-acetylmuramic acid kinase [Gemmatimonadales bacterium]|nr:MAG: anhydro-N-acetylmuramic acid kinase [Gemmatimonadales bacterium]